MTNSVKEFTYNWYNLLTQCTHLGTDELPTESDAEEDESTVNLQENYLGPRAGIRPGMFN